jgi:sulfotransferase
MKKIHFMSGLPRSGSTLLTSILNQHPKIYSSHQTDLINIINKIKLEYPDYESVMAGTRVNSCNQIIEGIGQLFYSDIDKEIIIDKNRGWSTLHNIKLAGLFSNPVKIIFPYRKPIEILASFISLAEKNPNNFIDKNMIAEDFLPYYYMPRNDARCEWLMQNRNQISFGLFGLRLAQSKEYKDNIHIVEYDKLCKNPQEEMNKIYNFLEIDSYSHNFKNIINTEKQNDMEVYGVPDLHEIKTNISASSINPYDILSEYVINKYSKEGILEQ